MNPAEKLYEMIWKDQASAAPYIGGNQRVDLAIQRVRPGKRLLDLGCSDGVLAQALSMRFSQVYGVDVSERALAKAAERGIDVRKVNLDTERLPFDDEFFDVVTCLDLIEHVFEPRTLIREVERVLSPRGALYIAFPNMRYLVRIKELLYGRFPKTSGDLAYSYDGGHLHYYTPLDVRSLLQERGMHTVAQWGVVSGGIKSNWKYRLLRSVLPEDLGREFLSIEVMLQAVKQGQP